MTTFKVGDKVYCPALGKGVYTLDISLSDDEFIVRADNGTYLDVNENGRYLNSDLLPHIFHVTEENREKLEALYGLEFEKPEPEMVKIGNLRFPKPESEPLMMGDGFFTPDLGLSFLYTRHFWYDNSDSCNAMLSRGLVHKTAKAAEQHAKVLIAISQGKTSF